MGGLPKISCELSLTEMLGGMASHDDHDLATADTAVARMGPKPRHLLRGKSGQRVLQARPQIMPLGRQFIGGHRSIRKL